MRNTNKFLLIISFIIIIFVSSYLVLSYNTINQNENFLKIIYAGWRSSIYGHQLDKPPNYWVSVAKNISSRFTDSQPSGIWILGTIHNNRVCFLQFPNPDEAYYPYIEFSSNNENEKYLEAFDNAGVKVWLQVEPGNADVGTLIDLVLNEYKHHSCVLGFGIDVEWLESDSYSDGRRVTTSEVNEWLNKVKSHDSNYKLFLKHWELDKMPTDYPSDIVFINDSCDAINRDELVSWFISWANAFSDGKVGFQIGYDLDTNGDGLTDKDWWSTMNDPLTEIGGVLFENISNCEYYYWVDFTILDVFP